MKQGLVVGGNTEPSHLARRVATEEETICLSHNSDSRCLNRILGRKAGKTSENNSSHRPKEQKGRTYT